MRSHFWDRIVAQYYQFFINFSPPLPCAPIFLFFLSSFTFLFTLSHALRSSLLLVLSVTCHCRSRALRPLLTLSFIFSPPLCFPFSLNLEFVGLGCGRDAKLGVVRLRWFFVDRWFLWWFVLGHYGRGLGCGWAAMVFWGSWISTVVCAGSLQWFSEWVLRFHISEL